MLELHPKTVRGFIHDGRLKARKAGKKWRILKKDLEAFMGGEMGQAVQRDESIPGWENRIQVSAIVDIFVRDANEALRISNSIIAVINSKDREYGNVRCDYIYYETEKKARFILWGRPRFIANLLTLLSKISE